MQDLEGYDEMEAKFLRTLPLERRLLGLTPEERLELLPLLPDEFLRQLQPDALATLPPKVRKAIKKRIR